MINIISQLSRHANLLKNIQFMFHRKPRDPSVPTQSSILEPFNINKLHDNPGARYYPKILGRGRASGKGKTCGRGHKGHWARQGGGPHVRFEGGQTPIQKRLPKYGKVKENRPREILDYVNLSTIDYYIKLGVLNPQQTITIKTLVDTGIVKKVKFGVKILGKGADRITQPLKFEVTDASKTAIKYVTEQGGEIKLIHRTPLKLKEHVFPDKYPIPLMDPITPYWKVKKLMRKEEDRGLPISYPKPQWLSDDIKKEGVEQARAKQIGSKSSFEFPVPIVQNSGKIRKRKPQVYRKFNYNLP